MAVAGNIRPAALIPCYNNAATVGDVIERSLRQLDDLLVVDDGSTDVVGPVLASFGDRIRIQRREHNQGKGAALRLGFDHLLEAGFTHAISIDADGQHAPEDIPRIVNAIESEPTALVVGKRDMRAAGAPRRSLFGLWFSNRLLRLLGSARLEDSQCGFRGYPLGQLTALRLRGCRYDLELEVLVKAARRGLPLLQVPIECTYQPAGGRVSHFRPVRDFAQIGLQMLRLLCAELFVKR